MILGIDASTPGSGGAKRHLIEILKSLEPSKYGFRKVIIWGVKNNLDQIPSFSWLEKITHPLLNKNFIYRTFWQLFHRNKNFQSSEIDVLFCPFGTYIGNFRPYVVMSRNMLIFDKNEQIRFGWSWMRLKLIILNYTQRKSFNNASGIIFISEHAKNVITAFLNENTRETAVIHHGVAKKFQAYPKHQFPIENYNKTNPLRILYVSSIWIYKHPWNVVKAVKNLRIKGYPIVLDIVGAGEQKSASDMLSSSINLANSDEKFIFWHQKVGLEDVDSFYKKADIFVFASTCENMPNILIEAMSSGIPIICSRHQPMPEFLKDYGLYIDPLDVIDIETKLEYFILNPSLRQKLAKFSYDESLKYSWDKCANETFDFMRQIMNNKKN